MQTVLIQEPSDRPFDILDTFEDYLQYNRRKVDLERILIFGYPYMISVLKGSKFWFADGTFKLSPRNFYQFYTHHVYCHIQIPNPDLI